MADDTEVALTVEETGLPIEYVQAVYDSEETSDKPNEETPVEEGSSSPQASESGSESPATPAEEPVDSGDIPEKLAIRAKAYGLDPEHFRDSDALQGQIDAYDRHLLEQQQQLQQQQQQPQQQMQPQLPQGQQPQAQPGQQPPAAPAIPEFKFDLGDDEDYDPEVLEKMNAGLQKVAEHYQPYMDYLAQLGQMVEQQNQYIQQQAQREQAGSVEATNAAFDKAVDELDFEGFGKGRYEALQGTEQQQRQKLMDTATSLVSVYNQRGMPVPDIPELVQESFRLAFAEESKKANQAELRDKLVDRSKRRLGTGKSSKSSYKKANGKVKAYQGKDPEKDPVLMGVYNDMIAEQDFK